VKQSTWLRTGYTGCWLSVALHSPVVHARNYDDDVDDDDLILTYKILFGLTDMNQSDFFTFADRTHSTRGHAYKLLPATVE